MNKQARGIYRQFEWLETAGVSFTWAARNVGDDGVVVAVSDQMTDGDINKVRALFEGLGFTGGGDLEYVDPIFFVNDDINIATLPLLSWQEFLAWQADGSLLLEMLAAADAQSHSVAMKLAGFDRTLAAYRLLTFTLDASEQSEFGDFVWVGSADYLDEDELAAWTDGLDAEVFVYEQRARVWARKSHAAAVATRLAGKADGWDGLVERLAVSEAKAAFVAIVPEADWSVITLRYADGYDEAVDSNKDAARFAEAAALVQGWQQTRHMGGGVYEYRPLDFEALNESLADFIKESERQAQEDFEEANSPDGSYDFEVEIHLDHWDDGMELTAAAAAAFWAQSDWTPSEDNMLYGSVNTHGRRWLR